MYNPGLTNRDADPSDGKVNMYNMAHGRDCRKGSSRLVILVVLALTAGMLVTGFVLEWFTGKRDDLSTAGKGTEDSKGAGERATSLSAAERQEFEDLKDVAIGYLENTGDIRALEKADDAFSELIRKLPDDPLAYRNLVITRIVVMHLIDAMKDPSAARLFVERSRPPRPPLRP